MKRRKPITIADSARRMRGIIMVDPSRVHRVLSRVLRDKSRVKSHAKKNAVKARVQSSIDESKHKAALSPADLLPIKDAQLWMRMIKAMKARAVTVAKAKVKIFNYLMSGGFESKMHLMVMETAEEVKSWRKHDRQFDLMIPYAQTAMEGNLLERLQLASMDDWRAGAFLLERLNPAQFGQKSVVATIEISPTDVGNLLDLILSILGKFSPERKIEIHPGETVFEVAPYMIDFVKSATVRRIQKEIAGEIGIEGDE